MAGKKKGTPDKRIACGSFLCAHHHKIAHFGQAKAMIEMEKYF